MRGGGGRTRSRWDGKESSAVPLCRGGAGSVSLKGVDDDRSAGESAGSGRRVGRRRPPAFRFEICVVDGPEGRELTRQQAAVIRDVVLWVAEHRREADRESDAQEVTHSSLCVMERLLEFTPTTRTCGGSVASVRARHRRRSAAMPNRARHHFRVATAWVTPSERSSVAWMPHLTCGNTQSSEAPPAGLEPAAKRLDGVAGLRATLRNRLLSSASSELATSPSRMRSVADLAGAHGVSPGRSVGLSWSRVVSKGLAESAGSQMAPKETSHSGGGQSAVPWVFRGSASKSVDVVSAERFDLDTAEF